MALAAVVALMPAVIHGEVLKATWFAWDVGITFCLLRRRPEHTFHAAGYRDGHGDPALFRGYMEEEKQGITRFYVLLMLFIGGFVMMVCAANLLLAYVAWELIGLVLVFPCGLLVPEARRGEWRAQGADHHPPSRLWAARRDHAALCSNRNIPVDGPGHRECIHRRHRVVDDRGRDGQVGHVSPAHLDPRSDECANAGFGPVALGVLCQGGRVS